MSSHRTIRFFLSGIVMGVCALAWGNAPAIAQHDDALIKDVLSKVNATDLVKGTEDSKSYKILFDAYLKLTKPPFEVGPEFNLNTIHPKMSSWEIVSGWAEGNTPMAQAILKCKDKNIIGLPYGREGLDPEYVKAGLIADIGVGGQLRRIEFPYLNAIDTIAAFSTAETYRLLEAGQNQQALDLAIATCFVLRQCCDRDFYAEKLHAIELLTSAMSNMRDEFYLYRDKIDAKLYTDLAMKEIPFLRPDRARLMMPEADRVLAEALIKDAFNARTGEADPDRFTETFAEIQSKDLPLTRFGAAKRWRMIAAIHGSLDASLERLKLIYDDWWRRWRIDAYDNILSFPTELDRTNPIRYAAVIYSVRNVAALFEVRNRLITEVNGTAMSAGLCAYRRTFGVYPDNPDKTYSQFTRKRSDADPYDKELKPFKYLLLDKRTPVNVGADRLWLEAGEGLLWSLGQDHEDQRVSQHSDDGLIGDIMIWPPVKSIEREQGLLQ